MAEWLTQCAAYFSFPSLAGSPELLRGGWTMRACPPLLTALVSGALHHPLLTVEGATTFTPVGFCLEDGAPSGDQQCVMCRVLPALGSPCNFVSFASCWYPLGLISVK